MNIFSYSDNSYFLQIINNPFALWSIRIVLVVVFSIVMISYVRYLRKKGM